MADIGKRKSRLTIMPQHIDWKMLGDTEEGTRVFIAAAIEERNDQDRPSPPKS